ncbi:MAG TPA: hypothetical protein DCX07_15510 [Phycisphaerales bacterium]|nr:hypothetical protein [Phycisphaerales bacterium]
MSAEESAAGRTMACAFCGQHVRVPEPRQPCPAEPAPAQAPPPAPTPSSAPVAPRKARLYSSSDDSRKASLVTQLATFAMAMGLLAGTTCWVPVVGRISPFICAGGLVLATLGLVLALRHSVSLAMPISGLVVCAVVLAGALIVRSSGLCAEPQSPADSPATPLPEGTARAAGDAAPPAVNPAAQDGLRNSAPSAPPKVEVAWHNAAETVTHEEMRVRIVSVHLAKAEVEVGAARVVRQAQSPTLNIVVELANAGATHKVDYATWAGGKQATFRDIAVLRDNYGNRYWRVVFGEDIQPVGRTASQALYPGNSLRDVLVFEKPVGTIEYLELELPAQNFGAKGAVRFRIPASWIRQQ